MIIVQAKISYKTGKYPALAYANDDDAIEVGDKVRVRVASGYETTCEILEIRERNVKRQNKYAEILDHPKLNEESVVIMFGAKTVEVKHISSDRRLVCYTDMDLKVGDTVVYDSGDKTYLHVGTVVNTDPDAYTAATTWIVDTVDLESHNERIRKAKAAQKLLTKLNAKKKQFQDIELLRLIAATDPETKEMLEEYTKLIGGK